MKKIFFILICFVIFQLHTASNSGKWDYYRLRYCLKRRRIKSSIKPAEPTINLENLIEKYKEQQLSQEEKQWYARYYCRNRPEYY